MPVCAAASCKDMPAISARRHSSCLSLISAVALGGTGVKDSSARLERNADASAISSSTVEWLGRDKKPMTSVYLGVVGLEGNDDKVYQACFALRCGCAQENAA